VAAKINMGSVARCTGFLGNVLIGKLQGYRKQEREKRKWEKGKGKWGDG